MAIVRLFAAAAVVVASMQFRRPRVIPNAPRIDTKNLTAAFRTDPTGSAQRFGGKQIIVTGGVTGMNGGLVGEGCVYLEGDTGTEIHCNVNADFRSIRPGARATIMGTCDHFDLGVLTLEDCEALRK